MLSIAIGLAPLDVCTSMLTTLRVGRPHPGRGGATPPAPRHGAGVTMKRKEYEAELRTLQAELVAMQEWVKAAGAKVCVVFEGRDTAGKGARSRPSPTG